MKKTLIFSVAFFIASCHHEQPTVQVVPAPSVQSPIVQSTDKYQVVQQPNGTQVVVVKDEHSMSEFFMDYLMFQSLMNMAGGFDNVNRYYNNNRYNQDWDRQQTTYRTTTKTVINNYYSSSGQKFDDKKPLTEQIKYTKSNGFTKQSQPTPYQGQKSNGFTGGSTPYTPVKTETKKPVYTPSSGFTRPSTTTSSPKPSKSVSGFGKSFSGGSKSFGG
jgi:hypothetical protein